MLSPLDDYPIHQISEPMRFVGTSDRNFYDRYYFNIHGADGVHGIRGRALRRDRCRSVPQPECG